MVSVKFLGMQRATTKKDTIYIPVTGEMTVKDVQEKLGANTAVMVLPIGKEKTFKGVVDLLTRQAFNWDIDELGLRYSTVDVPSEMKKQVEKYRQKLIEKISETDEVLLEKYNHLLLE